MQRVLMTIAALLVTGVLYTATTGASTAQADGYREPRARAGMCGYHKQARYLLSLAGTDRLRPEVEERYQRAVRSEHASMTTGSPRFIWSLQAKVACAKAIGYLNYPFHRQATRESLQKCECLSNRMAAFGG